LALLLVTALAGCVVGPGSDLGEQSDTVPHLSFKKDWGAEWSTFTVIKITNGPVTWGQLDASCMTGDTNSYSNAAAGTDSVGAGDSFQCVNGATLKIIHVPTETLIYGPVTV
jgi:hypothetical protein